MHVVEEPQLLGGAGTLAENRDFVAGEDAFYILYADVLTNVDLRKMLAFHRQQHLPVTLGVYQVPDPRRCGVVTVDENAIVQEFEEKPKRPAGNLGFFRRDGCGAGTV